MAIESQHPDISRNQLQSKEVSPFLEVSGAVTLKDGQNFYDQPPFNQIFEQISSETDMEIDAIRFFTTGLVNKIAATANYEHRRDSIQVFREDLKSPVTITNIIRKPYLGYQKQHVGRTVFQVLSRLDGDGYPNWKEYVQSQIAHQYSYKGEYRDPKSNVSEALPKTYMGWLEEKFARDRRLEGGTMIQSVQEEFPQQFGKTPETGDVRKRWRITRTRGLNK